MRSPELFRVARVEIGVRRIRRLWNVGATVLWILLGLTPTAFAETPFSVELDLQQQRAYLIRGRQLVMESPISSGRYGHLTETGEFKIIEKERNHFSSIYGKIVDARGNTIVADADADMKVPRGGKFVPAPMRYFMRFHGATGLHVFGRTPRTNYYYRYDPQPTWRNPSLGGPIDPRMGRVFDRRFDPRYQPPPPDPWWR